MYASLGLRDDDETSKNTAEGGGNPDGCTQEAHVQQGDANIADDDRRATEIPAKDFAPSENLFIYDKNNPKIELDIMFPNMKEFRLVVRQHAIDNEFELATEKSCTTKFQGRKKKMVVLGRLSEPRRVIRLL